MNNELGRKITSLTLMTIMVAGGFAFSNPYGIVQEAEAQQSNPNLFVSAENAQFENHVVGAQVVEVVVLDPQRSETDQQQGEPDVDINGNKLRMVQATDGNWYGYFADRQRAQIADQIVVDQGATAGTGLDFGVFCDSDSRLGNVTFTQTVGVAFNTIPAGAQTGNGVQGTTTIQGNTCLLDDSSDFGTNGTINVVREPLTPTPATNLGGGVNTGQIGISNAGTQNGDGAWPFIQLYNFNPTGEIEVEYNAAGGDQIVDLTYDEASAFIEESMDRDKYPQRGHVHISIADWSLNIDPTDEDSWTFGAGDGTMFYQVFTEDGVQVSADGDLADVAPSLDDLLFEEGPFELNPTDQRGNDILSIVDNDDSVTNGTITDSIQEVAAGNSTDPLNTSLGPGSLPVTFIEDKSNNGVFITSDENDDSVIRVDPDAQRGTTAVWGWDDDHSILVGFAFANVNMDEGSVGGEWNAAEEIEVILTDQDLNTNSHADEDLNIFNPNVELIPALKTGKPFVLQNSTDRFFFLTNFTVGEENPGDGATGNVVPVADGSVINVTQQVQKFSARAILQNNTGVGISLDSSGDSSGTSNTVSGFLVNTTRTLGDLRNVVRNSSAKDLNGDGVLDGSEVANAPFRGFSFLNYDLRSFEQNKGQGVTGTVEGKIESIDIWLVLPNRTDADTAGVAGEDVDPKEINSNQGISGGYCMVQIANNVGLQSKVQLPPAVLNATWHSSANNPCGSPGNIDEEDNFGILFGLDDENTGFLELGTSEHPVIVDFHSFGFINDGIPEEDRVADQLVRLELEETGDNTAEFEGEISYTMVHALNILDQGVFGGLETRDDDPVIGLLDDEVDEDAPRINYNDRGADGVVTPVADQQDAPTHSGVVELNADNYKIADTVEVTLTDQDLNLDTETIEIFTTVTPNTGSPESDAVGKSNSFQLSDGTFLGRMLDITFDDERWIKSDVNVDVDGDGTGDGSCSLIGGDDGLDSTDFTLVETGRDTGVFKGDFQIPSQYCSRNNDNSVQSTTGTDLEVNYVDFRDASGEIVEVGDGAGVRANTGSVSFDRTVYPVPFGSVDDFATSTDTEPSGRSVFPVHQTGASQDTSISGDTSAGLDSGEFLANGNVKMHIRINDPDFDVNPQGEDQIAQNVSGQNFGPVKFTMTRTGADNALVLATAGADTAAPGNITRVGEGSRGSTVVENETRELGPIDEIAPDAGIYEVDLSVRYTDGPTSSACPSSPTGSIDAPEAQGFDGTNRFSQTIINDATGGSIQNCILQGDVITVEYTDPADASGNPNTVTDSASFDLRNGVLQSDKSVYIIGSDAIITLIDPDLDLDNDGAETYTLDLIEWDSDADTLTMGPQGGSASVFDPEPFNLRETGDSTGIFQSVIEFPEVLNNDRIERGEEVELEYEDWGPSGADFVGDEEEDVELTIWSSNFGATVELDQKVYTWTDKVFITIVAPDHNFDSNLIDEIGDTDDDEVRVSTRGNNLQNYRLAETGTDTGIFTGEVILTGFDFNADGDTSTGSTTNGFDTNPRKTGSGPTDGFLPADDDDGLTVSFEFTEDETVVGSALIRWNIGEVQWLEASYPATGQGVVRVIDPDMNLDPESVDNFEVDVWSDSDAGGIDLTVDETNEATGIFEGTVFFTVEDQSSGHRLRVSEGDTVTAEYEDNTLPNPYTTADELEITATTFIGTIVPPLERAPASNPRVVDAFGNELDQVNVDQQVQITADLTNGQNKDQPFAYLVQIQDQNGVTLELAWITGTLSPGQTLNPALSWTPESPGEYNVQVFVWQSVDDPSPLSEPLEFTIDVV